MLNKFRPLGRNMTAIAQRGYLAELGLDSHSIVERNASGKEQESLQLWKEQTKKHELVLSTSDEIEAYVISIVRDYFRTTKKAAVDLDSLFTEHGLDSLDAIEFVIRIEDELGYLIEAENLELFKKPRHFVNFIKQMEAYKTEFSKLPHEGNKYQFKMEEAFPGLPKMGH